MADLANRIERFDVFEPFIVTIIAAAVVSIVALAVSLCFKRNAAIRHSVLLSGLLCALSCPVLVAGFAAANVSIASRRTS